MTKIVFVTVGTTKFDDLIDKVDSPKLFNILLKYGYSKMIIQIGNYSGTIQNSLPFCEVDIAKSSSSTTVFNSFYFDYKPSLSEFMKNSDLIISHAGSGSILESLENNKPCICVVNDKLMDNHQKELADKLSNLSYILSTKPSSLYETIETKLNEYLKNRVYLDKSIHQKAQQHFATSLSNQFKLTNNNNNNNNKTTSSSTAAATATTTKSKKQLKTMVVLGSGGHTTEMFYLLKKVDRNKFSPITYVLADNDKRSEDKIKIEDSSSPIIKKIPRSRNVGQSFFKSIFTTLIALFYSMLLIFKETPDTLICNGPGTCVPLVVSVLLLRWLRIKKDSKIIYIESLARVNDLSLSGKILQHVSDWFVVQWPELLSKTDSSNVSCINLFFETF
ncbi:hypothetical protein RB653_009306 [Dictyostelium firmibasis]|uniref:UDP-N-acetylglucosamine transferase subunit ALG14 n=1 Tax=Dictyostelium firmibasis TaxID=79012 RepID=A0AAN7YUZ1_9MYCE